ncbi:MAG: hypothetical protein GQ542_13455 [Desulforhopalus sp.]|nr:hypothetical protein [Desulforhopalus sp.]
MKRRIIHEWRDWLLEYIGDDKYELIRKDDLSVIAIVAKDAMDAENQSQQIIKNTKKRGEVNTLVEKKIAEDKGNVASNDGSAFHGNVKSKVFHGKLCQHFNCKNCTIGFETKIKALKAGYRAHNQCVMGGVGVAARNNEAGPTFSENKVKPLLPLKDQAVVRRHLHLFVDG